MKSKRETIIFYLPLSMDALTRDVSPTSGLPAIFNETSLQINGAQNGSQKTDGVYWDKKKLYINPSSVRINDTKMIKDTLTKGGFMVQYWGENLTAISIGGTTGSAGIEGINVIQNIYRHEQLHFPKILEERDRRLAQEAIDQTINSAQQSGRIDSTATLGFTVADAILTGGEITSTIKGVRSTIGVAMDIASNGGSDYTPTLAPSIPTLAAFATNIQMYYDGVFYRGFFTQFNYSETGETPGLFEYTFDFKVTRKYGERKNFMPWHRDPLDANGDTQKSQGPLVSKGTYPGVNTLSYPLEPVEGEQSWQQRDYDNFYREETSGKFIGTNEQKSTFKDTTDAVSNTSISRRKLITG